jgi:Rrf2 family protein
MQKLTQAKIVKSFQGKKGGYGLVRSPDQISLKELLAAVEGKFFINRCLQFPENCIFVKDCKMHEVWQKVQNEMCSILERYHISDFI